MTLLFAILATAEPAWGAPQAASVDTLTLDVGNRALGFSPDLSGPVASIGVGRTLGQGPHSTRSLECTAGLYRQPDFASGALAEVGWTQTWEARWGGAAELGASVGAQSSKIPGTSYAADQDGALQAGRAPIQAAATLGAHIGLGWGPPDAQRPTRLWLRYDQLAAVPFMPDNGVPVMGLTHLSAGITTTLRPGASR